MSRSDNKKPGRANRGNKEQLKYTIDFKRCLIFVFSVVFFIKISVIRLNQPNPYEGSDNYR